MSSPSLLPWEDHAPRSTSLRVASAIARHIIEGSQQPGEVLTEVSVAEEFGVSRTPVRGAMLQLQNWGLVKLLPKKGAVVTAVTLTERRDLLDVRATWEARAVELICDDIDSRHHLADTLTQSLSEQRAALESADALAFAAHDFLFHLRVIESAHNTVVSDLLSTLGPRFARLTYLAVADDLAVARGFENEHRELVDLIYQGKASEYEKSVRAHISSGHFGAHAR